MADAALTLLSMRIACRERSQKVSVPWRSVVDDPLQPCCLDLSGWPEGVERIRGLQ